MLMENDQPSPKLVLTAQLLERAKAGDAAALDALMSRYLPRLATWASGRLPWNARSLLDTADLVQETLLRVIRGLDGIQVRGPGGFQAYVRQAILNRIRDQVRWAQRRPETDATPEDLTGRDPSPLEEAIGADVLDRYERALEQLNEEDRRLLHLRLELDFGYDEIALMTGRSSPDAARMAVKRSLRKVAEAMRHVP